MNVQIMETKDSWFRIGWTLLLIVAFIQALSAFFLWIGSGPTAFEADTGVAWNVLSRAFPTVAVQFTMAQQSSIVGALATGLLSLAILVFALRDGHRWAWFALWVLPASMIPGTISLAQTDNQAGVAVFGGALVLIGVAGLLLSYRALLQN